MRDFTASGFAVSDVYLVFRPRSGYSVHGALKKIYNQYQPVAIDWMLI